MLSAIHDHTIKAARALFPRGLEQPPGAFRFSADALLLAAFAARAPLPPGHPAPCFADLGAGCGVVAFALLLARPEYRAVGVELRAELAAAARANAARLGLTERFACLHADLAGPSPFAGRGLPAPAFCALAVANPPYRQRGKGRLPPSPARRDALFEQPHTLDAFCAAAASVLVPGGRFCIVYPYSRKATLLAALCRHGLAPARLLPVLPRQGEAPSLLLLEALSAAPSPDPIKEPPLALHQGRGTGFSPEALAFCPRLVPRQAGASAGAGPHRS